MSKTRLQTSDTPSPSYDNFKTNQFKSKSFTSKRELSSYLSHSSFLSTKSPILSFQSQERLLGTLDCLNNSHLEILKISPENLAKEITLLDYEIFKDISSEEFVNYAISSSPKSKVECAPVVVKFTKQFNQIIFWCVSKILRSDTLEERVEHLSYFIKIIKCLHDLNNLNSEYALISALRSASIYRLKKTWAAVSKKNLALFEKLESLFSETENHSRLRSYISHVKAPCIPYIGIYMTDLIYLDNVYKFSSNYCDAIKNIQSRNGSSTLSGIQHLKSTLEVLTNFQKTDYSHLKSDPDLRSYLSSITYLEGHQKLIEDTNFELSKVLEPNCNTSDRRHSTLCHTDFFSKDTSTPNKFSIFSNSSSPKSPFSYQHHKSYTLNSSSSKSKEDSKISNGDTSLLSFTTKRSSYDQMPDSTFLDANIHSNSSLSLDSQNLDDKMKDLSEKLKKIKLSFDPGKKFSLNLTLGSRDDPSLGVFYESVLKRKVVMNHGKKIKVKIWNRFWITLNKKKLYFYPAKKLNSLFREDFKRDPIKILHITDWKLLTREDINYNSNCFFLYNPNKGNLFKFKTSNLEVSNAWINSLKNVTSNSTESI